MWNVDAYLYDARLVRYVFFIEALLFMFVYLSAFGVFLDLVMVKGAIDKSDNAFDVLLAIFIGYNLVEFAPTAFVNLVLCLKEFTLKQTAFTK